MDTAFQRDTGAEISIGEEALRLIARAHSTCREAKGEGWRLARVEKEGGWKSEAARPRDEGGSGAR